MTDPSRQSPAATYRATLKSRKLLEALRKQDENTDAWGWWADVCPGQVMYLREATAQDLERCHLRESASRNPADWLCEPSARGSLVSKQAVDTLEALIATAA